jgi:hypothetical protein
MKRIAFKLNETIHALQPNYSGCELRNFMMSKRMLMLKYLLFSLLMLSKMSLYSQELFTKKLKWARQDSIETPVFKVKTQIDEWGKSQLPFSSLTTKEFSAKEVNFYAVIVSGCSGLPCLNIYIFTEKKGVWYLIAKTNARLKEELTLDVDGKNEKIIFKTKSGQVGELPFDTLVLKHDKIE